MKSIRAITVITICLTFILTGNIWATQPHSRRTPIVEAFEKNKNAVVNIASRYIVQQNRNSLFNFGFDDFFVPRRMPRQRELSSLGSGFVLDPRGYIVTNAHVVNHASEITIIFWNEKDQDQADQYKAQIIAINPDDDIALLKIKSDQPLTSVELGTSSDLMIGETALAIGNPLGYQHSLTDGVVSAIHRDLEFRNDMTLGDLIQVSAPINPGNSGGPLLNINGQVIGINTAINQAAQGIGFAIPIDRFKEVLLQMLAIDDLRRIDFGLQVTADPNNFTASPVISSIIANSPAERVGLRIGDRIMAVNGQAVASPLDFALEMLEQNEDSQVKIALIRQTDGAPQEHSVTVALKKRPKPQGDLLAKQLFGLELDSLTEGMISKYKIHGNPGDLIVLSVENDSPAQNEGVEVGDILVAVKGQKVADLDKLGLELEHFRQGQLLRLTFNRTQKRKWSTRIFQFEVNCRAQIDAVISQPPVNRVDL